MEGKVEVKDFPETAVAYVRYIGPYKGDAKLFEGLFGKLMSWAGPRGLVVPDAKSLIIYHDNPDITDESKLRVSVCLTVPADTKTDGEIGKMTIEKGRYAFARFSLTPADYGAAWNWVFGTWLPSSGYQCDDRPCFELYHGHEGEGGRMEVDICVPVRPL
jgi:AraC family transcriptional regulator